MSLSYSSDGFSQIEKLFSSNHAKIYNIFVLEKLAKEQCLVNLQGSRVFFSFSHYSFLTLANNAKARNFYQEISEGTMFGKSMLG